jgi:hypothetical protein
MPVEPAAKLEHADKPKRPAVKVRKAKAGPVVTNTVLGVDALKPRMNNRRKNTGAVTNTNAARQSRWRSKQDAAALRGQARERMKVLRARRAAAGK